jgi:hypothetical protein
MGNVEQAGEHQRVVDMLLRIAVLLFHLSPILALIDGRRFLALAFALLLLLPYIKVKKIEASLSDEGSPLRDEQLARKARWERLTLRSVYANTRR